MDIRTILLTKIKANRPNCYSKLLTNETANNYITIGSYDALIIYETEKFNTIFDTSLKKQNNSCNYLEMFYEEKKLITENYFNTSDYFSGNSFFHPIHIVNLSNTNYEEFWKGDESCVAVTIVYSENNNLDIEDVVNTILPKKNNTSNKISYAIYHSLNMADYVIVWKSNSLYNILKTTSNISYSNFNIYTHTICGFKYPCDESIINKVPNEKIPLVKISGTIRDHVSVYDIFKKIKNSLNTKTSYCTEFLSFGSNDFNLIYSNISTKCLIKTIYNLMYSSDIDTALSSIKTRVNLKYTKTSSLQPNGTMTKIHMKNLVSYAISVLESFKKYDWANPFAESLNMLSDMCENIALSNVNYFVADSLHAFCNELAYLLNNYTPEVLDTIININIKRINSYITAFNSLINQLVRVDGYMSQEPGYSPLVYNMITADILEYYNAYIYKLIDKISTLTDKECKNTPQKYSMLLVPSLTRIICIDDIFKLDYSQKSPVFPPYQTNLVTIPYKHLYSPQTTLCAITHEIMHFCGENIRCRDLRVNAILSFISEEIISDFDLICNNNETTEYLFSYLHGKIKIDDCLYLSVLERLLPSLVDKIYKSVPVKEALLHIYSNNSLDGDSDIEKQTKYAINFATTRRRITSYTISETIFLFRECYADFMSILFINIGIDKYYEEIFKEINEIPDDGDHLNRVALFVQRIAIVLNALKNTNKFDIEINSFIKKECEKSTDFFRHILYVYDVLQNNKNSNIEIQYSNSLFPVRSLLCVCDYLSNCYVRFSSIPNINEKLEDIRQIYISGTKNMFDEKFVDTINQNRSRISEMLEKIYCDSLY